MAIDWAPARLEYINNAAVTYADIADKYGGNPSVIRRRGSREGWTEERVKRATLLQHKATEKSVYSQSEQLAACNQRHLELAEKLEQAVKQRLERADKLADNGLRCVSAVAEAAQRIARLALGVSTKICTPRITPTPR